MSAKLEWLTEDQWTVGSHARDDNSVECNPASLDAVTWDLFGALRVSYFHDEDFYEAVDSVKRAFKFLFKEKYEKLTQEAHKYYREEGRIIHVTTLYEMNDMLTWAEVKRLLFYMD
jgi:hypothetical protein